MTHAIRKYSRDFIAIIGLVLLAGVIGWIIVQNERLRVPILEDNPFDLNVQMDTAQAVVAGQGQTVRVAGVRVGDVVGVQVKDGKAVIRTEIDRKFLPIYRDATVLLRPKTGLKDMFLELDPGSKGAGKMKEGATIPSSNTAPDVNLDEILAGLDTDTRDYLKMLIAGAGQGLKGRAKDLGHLFKEFDPLNKSLQKLNGAVAERRTSLQHLVHNFNLLTGALAQKDTELTRLVSSSNQALGAIGGQDANVRSAVAQLPGALRETRIALTKSNDLGDELGPTFEALRPFARRLDRMNRALTDLAGPTTAVVRDQLRPFVKAANGPLSDLKPTAKRFATAMPDLEGVFERINNLGNLVAYNQNGAESPDTKNRAESYLFWVAWLGHQADSIFQSQDANSIYRRLYATVSCQDAADLINGSPLGPAVGALTGMGSILDQAC